MPALASTVAMVDGVSLHTGIYFCQSNAKQEAHSSVQYRIESVGGNWYVELMMVGPVYCTQHILV